MIQDIMEQRLFQNVNVKGGHSGVFNEITWVNVMEILDSPETVARGELLVTTGYSLQDEALHADLIPRLKSRGVSGLAIQPGYYIDSIPQYILDQADQNGFPVLEFPKNLTFSEILRVLIQKINSHKLSISDPDGLQQKALSFLEQVLIHSADEIFQNVNGHSAHLLLVKSVNYSPANESVWNDCLNQLRSFLLANTSALYFHNLENGNAVLLVSFPCDFEYEPLFYELNIKLTYLSEQHGNHYYIGVEKLQSEEQLGISLQHAASAIEVLRTIKAKRGVCSYENITFVKMFGTLHQNDRSIVLENQALQILLNYDRINESNYVHTLRTYLATNCNISRTAKQLFIHRHTLLKRLDKITALCNLNLSDYYARIYMSIALLFHDYFAY